MRKHAGMRPQDVAVLLKILSFDHADKGWQMRDIGLSLGLSPSEVSESLHRSNLAELIDFTKRQVNRFALREFLVSGISYVFPQKPGPMVRGVKTAHSAPPLNKHFKSGEDYVWPDAEGDARGQAIEPLYPTLVKAAKADPFLYQALALIDAIRAGRARERELAKQELEKLIMDS